MPAASDALCAAVVACLAPVVAAGEPWGAARVVGLWGAVVVGLACAAVWLRHYTDAAAQVELSGDENGDAAELVELRLRVRKGGAETEETVRVRPDAVDLSAHTGLVALPEELRSCAGRVRALKVLSERLEALPAWLGELTGLTELQVGGWWDAGAKEWHYCPLRALPAEVGRLTGLRILFLDRCSGLTALPNGLGALTRLETLDLGGCSGLTALPAGLVALTRLDLSDCSGLPALPDEIGALTRLRWLGLGGCSGLTALPAGIGALTRLRRLELSKCPALHTPPPRVARAGTAAVLAFLRDLRGGAAPCHLVKVVLLGDQRAGKSSLADSLVRGRPATRRADDRTVGIEVRRWPLGAGQELVAHIYDAAGHRVYRASHGAFMSPEALFLHVVRSDVPEAAVAAALLAWLEAVQQEAPGAVMGVVFTHADLLSDDAERDRRQQAVLARVQAEVQRQVRAVDEAMRQAEGAFEADAAWREKQARRDKALEALDRGLTVWQGTDCHSDDSNDSDAMPGPISTLICHSHDSDDSDGSMPLLACYDSDDSNDSDAMPALISNHIRSGCHTADNKAIGTVADALARLSTLHYEMHELEARLLPGGACEQDAHGETQQQLQRLREQRVRRPRLLFSFGVSSKTGHGLADLRRALAALMQDQRLFPHVGMKVPLSYAMLERLAQEGREPAAPGQDEPCIEFMWVPLQYSMTIMWSVVCEGMHVLPNLEVVKCQPEHADTALNNTGKLVGKLALAIRGEGSFQEKARRVESAGALGLIIVNTEDELFPAGGDEGYVAGIPVVMIKAGDAEQLLKIGDSSCLRPKQEVRAAWEHAVTEYVEKTASAGLRALCAQPYALLRDLVREAAGAGLDAEQLHRALQFLHATGSVLHYGAGARQHSRRLQEVVFMRPHFIIDAIKYVIREASGEDINDELRALDDQIRGTALERDLEGLLTRGEVTRSLLTELWRHLSWRDCELMLELMSAFKLLRGLGRSGRGACERYIVPAMLPNIGLPDEYVKPQWWCPSRAKSAAVVRGEPARDGIAVQAAMRVKYEVVGGRLPFSFMTELQVSLVLQKAKGQKTFSPEASVVDRVAGSVLSESYVCEGGHITEWVVVSQCTRACRVGSEEGDSLSAGADSIRIMAWAELFDASQQGATDWRLLARVMREIEEAAHMMPAMFLRKLVLYVDGENRCAEAEEVDAGFLAEQFVTFTFKDGTEERVKVAAVLPQDGAETRLTAGTVVASRARGGARNCMDAFFAKTVDDTGIDVHAEGQLITRAVLNPGAGGWDCTTHPQPTLQDLRVSMGSAATRNVKLLHLSGHGRRECGFLLNADDAATASAPTDIQTLIDLISGAAGQRGPLECAVLNACSTMNMGQLLRNAGMSHVVCWKTPVHDETAREFCHLFYQALVEQTRGGSPSHRNYRDAFAAATDAMRVHAFSGGAAHLPPEAAGSSVGKGVREGEGLAADVHLLVSPLQEHVGTAQQTRAKVMPWQEEDAIQLLSEDGDSEVIYLWRKRAPRHSEEVHGAVSEQATNVAKKRKFVFFSCRVGTDIDPSRESQELEDRVFRQYGQDIQYKHHPRPETRHFTLELEHLKAGTKDVSLHFSGHGDGRRGSLCWHGAAGRRQKEMQIRGKQLATLIKLNGTVENIDSFFLNACCTLSTGLELHANGVRNVVCWQTPVTDATARDFALRFYELSCKASGQYAKAFETVCNEMAGDLFEARPCFLEASSGQGEQSGLKMWNGEEVVQIDEELLNSPHFLQPTTFSESSGTLHDSAGSNDVPCESVGGGQVGAGEEDDEEDVYKNWRPPCKDTDFAAHAGQAEKSVLQRLNFNLLLNGKEIGGSHGLDAKGFYTGRPAGHRYWQLHTLVAQSWQGSGGGA